MTSLAPETYDLSTLSLEELRARRALNKMLWQLNSKVATHKEFAEIDDILLVEINARLSAAPTLPSEVYK